MLTPASPRSPFVCPTLVALLLLVGCGNRGELYLAPSDDTALEAELERLGIDPVPTGELGADPAADPSPLVPGEGVAPSVAPDLDEGEGGEPEDEEEEEERGGGDEGGGA